MAITDAYATAAQYRAVTGKTDTSQDANVLIDLKAVSRYIDGKMGRFFNVDASDVARVYVPADNLKSLWVDDLSATPTTIKLDTGGDGTFTTTLEATDFELLPLNADKGPEPRPYTRIGMTPWGNYSGFEKNIRVQITGKFGWPSIPVAIQQATIHLAAILRLESPRATTRIAELGDVMETSRDAQNIIYKLADRYKRVKYL